MSARSCAPARTSRAGFDSALRAGGLASTHIIAADVMRSSLPAHTLQPLKSFHLDNSASRVVRMAKGTLQHTSEKPLAAALSQVALLAQASGGTSLKRRKPKGSAFTALVRRCCCARARKVQVVEALMKTQDQLVIELEGELEVAQTSQIQRCRFRLQFMPRRCRRWPHGPSALAVSAMRLARAHEHMSADFIE